MSKKIEAEAPAEDAEVIGNQKQVAALKVGDTHSISLRLEGDEATKAAIQSARNTLRNRMAAPVNRVRREHGRQFSIESGEFFTRSLDLLVVVAATRTE